MNSEFSGWRISSIDGLEQDFKTLELCYMKY